MSPPNSSKAPKPILSPLRYPGGKAGLANFLTSVLQMNGAVGCHYYEPFAGGAGAACRLLSEGTVNELFLNDAAPCIYAFWVAAIKETERFVDSILNIPLTIEEWRNQQSICLNPTAHSTFDVGLAAFYLNRCNRSGIIFGAGPIGGYAQDKNWRLDARFNRETLASRIYQLGCYRDGIHIYNLDAIDFLKIHLPKGRGRRKVFAYLDPPYFSTGRRLYYNYYTENDHRALAKYVLRQKTLKWMMTYDNIDFICKIYEPCQEFLFSLRYSLQMKQKARELLIIPNHLAIPDWNASTQITMDLYRVEAGDNERKCPVGTA